MNFCLAVNTLQSGIKKSELNSLPGAFVPYSHFFYLFFVCLAVCSKYTVSLLLYLNGFKTLSKGEIKGNMLL